MGSCVGQGCTVESFAVLAAGARLADGETVPTGQIYAGAPAKYLRDLTQQEKHLIGEHHLEMQQLAQVYHEMTEMDFREQIDATDDSLRYQLQDPQERIQSKLFELGMPQTHEDMEYMEHRVYHDYVGTVDHGAKDASLGENAPDRGWTPYEQDLTQYPEVFKKYQENWAKYDQVKARFENEDTLAEQADGPFVRRLPKDMSPWETKYDTTMPRYTGTAAQ